jgi:hypothetical protein
MILLLYFTVLFYCERWYVHSGGWAGTSIINFSFFFFFFFFPIHTVHRYTPSTYNTVHRRSASFAFILQLYSL